MIRTISYYKMKEMKEMKEIKDITVLDNNSGTKSKNELNGNMIYVNVNTKGCVGELVLINLWEITESNIKHLEKKYSKIANNSQAKAIFSINIINKLQENIYSENLNMSSSNLIITASVVPKPDAEYYNTEGINLKGEGKDENSIYITTKEIINQYTKGSTTNWEKVKQDIKTMSFTEKYGLNNKQMLDRAHWVYGEGGGFMAVEYAISIKNLKSAGKSGYGPTPFSSEEEMYKSTMLHKTRNSEIICLYPGYFDGKKGGANAIDFAEARKKGYSDLMDKPKMIACIKAVIYSLDYNLLVTLNDNSTKNNDLTKIGYNNWRGSGDKLYTEKGKKEFIEKNPLSKINGNGIKRTFYYFWESVNDKFRRHTFIEISK